MQHKHVLGAASHAGWKPRLLATQLLRPWSRSSYATSWLSRAGSMHSEAASQRAAGGYGAAYFRNPGFGRTRGRTRLRRSHASSSVMPSSFISAASTTAAERETPRPQ